MSSFDPCWDTILRGSYYCLTPRQQRRSTRRCVAPRLVAKRLQKQAMDRVDALPPSCDRGEHHIDFQCLESGQVAYAYTNGVYVHRSECSPNTRHRRPPPNDPVPQQQRRQQRLNWDFVRCPINHYGKRCIHPLGSSCGFLVGLESGDYYHVGMDGRVASLQNLTPRPRRRYEPMIIPGNNMASSLASQWNRTSSSRMKNLVEIHNWRDGRPLCVCDWDFLERPSGVYALQATSDFLGLHDYRMGVITQRANQQDKYQICFCRSSQASSVREGFVKCCFLNEHVVASASTSLSEPIRLWDLRNTRASTGSILSFPLEKSAAPLHPYRALSNDASHISLGAWTDNGEYNSTSRIVDKLQRFDDQGNILLSTRESTGRNIPLHLMIDPIEQTIKCLNNDQETSGPSNSTCLISLPNNKAPSLLACLNDETLDIIDIHHSPADPSPDPGFLCQPRKRRKPNGSQTTIGEMGKLCERILLHDLKDDRGLDTNLERIAWDKRNCRLMGLSFDLDVFECQL